MKITGISGGRRGSNNELLLRAALKEARRICGAELELIRLHDLNIKDCIGCETCMRGLTTGGDGKCVIKDDDMPWLADAVKDSDAVVLAAPVYDLLPSGTVVTLVNRVLGIGREYQLACRAKPKIGAVISVGGSDWVDFVEPIMDLTLHNLCKGAIVVDRMICQHIPAPNMIVLDEEPISRATLLGKRVAEALLDKSNADFRGDSGICPACHCNYLVPTGGVGVICPYCHAWGNVTVEGGKLTVKWDEDSVEKNRFTLEGQTDHRADIAEGHKRAAMNKDIIKQKSAALDDFGGKIIKPQKATQ
jgi:multimeric flavodoxin WrbA